MKITMNEQGILHIPDSIYCFPLGKNTLVLRLRMDRRDSVEKVEVLYECKYEIHEKQKCAVMKKKYEDRLFTYYEVVLTLADVRLAYVFRIWEKGKGFYFSEDGISEDYNFALGYFNFFQLPYINEADIPQEVEWMRDAVFYEIFVDRFYRGKVEKDTDYINMKWGEKPKPKSFAGGDLQGITEKLDYIRDLGGNVLYLTPVFKSVSNHKYDISDYYMIDRQFGNNEDLGILVREAHRKGIRVVLDAIFNHCSEKLFQFQDVLKKGEASPYHNWFVIRGDKPNPNKLNYEVFAFCSYMPKFNTSNPEVQEFLLNIAVNWIKEYDIDGWRLDVSDEISHEFWRLFRKRVKETKADCVIIGENWHDASCFLQGDQYDGIMNYAFTKACLDYYAYNAFDAQDFAWKLSQLLMRNTDQANRMMMNLLDSHDTDRFYTSVGKNKDRVLSAMAVMCMFVGAPCIYYGTEIPLEGGYDPDNRRCFDWEESHWDMGYRQKLKAILDLRRQQAVQSGEIVLRAEDGLFVLERRYENISLKLLSNQTGKPVPIDDSGKLLTENFFDPVPKSFKNKVTGNLQTDGYVVIMEGSTESIV